VNEQLIAVITFAIVLTEIAGCSKTSRDSDAAFKTALAERDKRIAALEMKQSQIAASPPVHHQTVNERIAEIDGLLSVPLTGRAEDVDRRTALRSERAKLGAPISQKAQPPRARTTEATATPPVIVVAPFQTHTVAPMNSKTRAALDRSTHSNNTGLPWDN
jgi:hypothetical protein